MRRCIIIFLLLVYPFQLALAMADGCCVVTAAGVSHHAVAADGVNTAAAAVAMADDEAGGTADPHCAACSFSHTAAAPPCSDIASFPHARTGTSAAPLPVFASHPGGRPERPQWSRTAA